MSGRGPRRHRKTKKGDQVRREEWQMARQTAGEARNSQFVRRIEQSGVARGRDFPSERGEDDGDEKLRASQDEKGLGNYPGCLKITADDFLFPRRKTTSFGVVPQEGFRGAGLPGLSAVWHHVMQVTLRTYR